MTYPSRKPVEKGKLRHEQMLGFADLTRCGVRKSEHKNGDVMIRTTGFPVSCPGCLEKINAAKKNRKAITARNAKIRKARREDELSTNYRDN